MSKKYIYFIIAFFVSIFIYFSFLNIPQQKIDTNVSLNTTKQIEVFLSSGTTTYETLVYEGSSVYDAMLSLSSTTPFSFVSKYYPSLGYFIEKIGNVSNADGYYWTLYINGKYSDMGVSNQFLKEGDVIHWEYEKL